MPYQDFVVCIACAIVKSYWLSFVSQHVIMSKPFKLIYLDIWGPGPSLGNSSKLTFFLLFNDTIWFQWIHFLNSRDQVIAMLLQFKEMVECKFYFPIKQVQSNGACKFKPSTKILILDGNHNYFGKNN